jgi:hypothetical protein
MKERKYPSVSSYRGLGRRPDSHSPFSLPFETWRAHMGMPHTRMQAAACPTPGVDTAGVSPRIFARPTPASLIAHYRTYNVARKNVHSETFQSAIFIFFFYYDDQRRIGRNTASVTRGENKQSVHGTHMRNGFFIRIISYWYRFRNYDEIIMIGRCISGINVTSTSIQLL